MHRDRINRRYRSHQHHNVPISEMPRIPISLLRQAHTIDPLLPALLAPCRSLNVAQTELRWMREHVDRVAKARRARGDIIAKGAMLRQLVRERSSGKPLQYQLGTEYFGDLEIQCRPGVLIPRQDTAASVANLVRLLRKVPKFNEGELRLLDLCTGTGCIPLLFQHELARNDVDLRVLAVDVSDTAINLARENMQRLSKSKPGQMALLKADVLIDPFADQTRGMRNLKRAMFEEQHPQFWDILISNPPYISPSAYWRTTTRSVRGFEPTLALVPPGRAGGDDTKQGDLFYPKLLAIARDVEAKIVLLEVANLEQAQRVVRLARALDIFDGIEVWREDPTSSAPNSSDKHGFTIVGEGNVRSVLCWRGKGSSWLGKVAAQDDNHRILQSSSFRPVPAKAAHLDTTSSQPQFDMSSWVEQRRLEFDRNPCSRWKQIKNRAKKNDRKKRKVKGNTWYQYADIPWRT
ncbi:S-adenosyl-L-methionine-dependent methyltransferase [Ampelomyces quisqualis]|uniref:S-adenosyl-L-methionine-dependent methyltransferase n=1 Tax=Ampelomyces quisqualis TaxID=50730 RepID=A0A6A5QTI1_AMPQU|nr:S-adenosyl-L-methionine-dependent methyltransferase [Ampelomyces quisqualis]